MKKLKVLLLVCFCAIFALFAIASGEDTSSVVDQGTANVANVLTADAIDEEDKDSAEEKDDAEKPEEDDNMLGDYSVEILSSRLAEDYEGTDVIIIKYSFTNVDDDEPASFSFSFDACAYQDGIGLTESYFVDDDADYNSDDQLKEIKKGATIEVEVAYELDNTTSPVEVEVGDLFGFEDKTITKTFEIAE